MKNKATTKTEGKSMPMHRGVGEQLRGKRYKKKERHQK